MTKFEEEFDNNVEIFDVIGNHNSICCEVDQVKEVFADWQLQQALPVVPECVAEFIESYKDRRTIYGVFDKISKNRKTYPKLYEWVSAKILKWLGNEGNDETFALAFITGKYQVEKPQLFYLKNKITGMYLSSDGKDLYEHHKNHGFKFTQEDINSLDTGSYELVPVEDGE